MIALLIALALIACGIATMILLDHHSLAVIWTNPIALFWDTDAKSPRANWIWWAAALFIFLGSAIIAEDWFGLGQGYSKDSGLTAEKKRAALEYERDPPRSPSASISQLTKPPQV
jgi:hypothetical protein